MCAPGYSGPGATALALGLSVDSFPHTGLRTRKKWLWRVSPEPPNMANDGAIGKQLLSFPAGVKLGAASATCLRAPDS